jgi:hypothetical protein
MQQHAATLDPTAKAHDGPLLGPCDLRSDPAADSRRNLCSHVRLAGVDPMAPLKQFSEANHTGPLGHVFWFHSWS